MMATIENNRTIERIDNTSFENRLLRELNYYGELEHTEIAPACEEDASSQMIIPLDEINVFEAEAADSYNTYLDHNFERVWENILADESLERLHTDLRRLPDDRRSLQLYLTNYCPDFRGKSMGLLIRY